MSKRSFKKFKKQKDKKNFTKKPLVRLVKVHLFWSFHNGKESPVNHSRVEEV